MDKLSIIRPSLELDEILDDFKYIIDTGIFTSGKYVEDFKNLLIDITMAKYSHPCSSATTALWIALKLLKIQKGDEVLISDFSFPATANVVEDLGAKPVFVDVKLDTFNMDPDNLEKRLSKKTKAVIFVDALGNPSGISDIKKICRKYEIPLIEDAACALGSSENGIFCGNIADITCFSFHPRKIICAGEGGAILTNNSVWNSELETKLAHGARRTKDGSLDFVNFGYNFRMSELQAALANVQLRKLDSIIQTRQAVYQQYCKSLIPLGFLPQKIYDMVHYNTQSACFIVPSEFGRDELIEGLRSQNIDCSIGTYSLSATTYYMQKYNDIQQNANFLAKNTVTLPCFDGVDVERVVNFIKNFCLNGKLEKKIGY